MCGLAGILAPFGRSADAGRASRMAALIGHRGPDDEGKHAAPDGRCVLASRRLAIIDLSADGHMPLSNENGDVWVAFNGEIYNHTALRAKLQGVGHRFRSRTDTETIVHAYEQWGLDFLQHIEGMFALALYDEGERCLVLARDRCGEKPLYFAWEGEALIFASEVKAIVATSGRSPRIDPGALSQYMTYGFVMPPRTLFSGVAKLAPAQALVVDRGSKVRTFSYWEPLLDAAAADEVRHRTQDEHVREVRRLIEASVAEKMAADVPVGAFLSGGVDSSTVVALMSRVSGRTIETVTVANEDAPHLDESLFAARIARHVGARFHRLAVSERDAIASLSDIAWHMDEPVSDPAALNTWFAAQYLRRRGVIVSLVGEGADEIFLGYDNYLRFAKLATIWHWRERFPRVLLRCGEALGSAALSLLGASVHRDLLRRACHGETLFLGTELFFPDIDKWPMVGARLRRGLRAFPGADAAAAIQASAPPALAGDPLGLFSFCETRMRMAEKLLMRIDKMSMAHSIEIRAPFLDRRLVDYALSIPSAVRTAGGVTKRLLKEAVDDLIPPDIVHRRKVGFSTPVAAWLTGEMGRHMEGRIGSARIFRDEILSVAEARRLLALHRASARSAKATHTKLWNILILAEWYDRFGVQGVEPPLDAAAGMPWVA